MSRKRGRLHVEGNTTRIIDDQTGEALGRAVGDDLGALLYIPKKHCYGRDFIVLFQSDLLRVAQSDLTGNDMRVLLVMLAMAEFENRVELSLRQIGTLIGMKPPNVHRSMKKLIAQGYVERSDNVYYLSAHSAWKGRIQAWQTRMQVGAPRHARRIG